MATDRIARVNELLRREISGALFSLFHSSDFDLSAITVTRVETNRNLREARVFVSIRDHQQDRKAMMSRLIGIRTELQKRINSNLVLKYTPRLFFELDVSMEKGNRVLGLISKIERENPPENTTENP